MISQANSNPTIASPSSNACAISFQQLSQDAAKRFLQTVVVIDDQARFKSEPPDKVTKENLVQARLSDIEDVGTTDALHTSMTVDIPLGTGAISLDELGAIVEPTEEELEEGLRHRLNAQELISCFAGEGLVCAVLKPEKENLPTVLGEAVKAARRADVVVVDWQILEEEKSGNHATQLITDILAEDNISGGRLRLLIVYTGEPDIYDIAKTIHKAVLQADIIQMALDSAKPVLHSDSVRIVVLAKQGSKAIENKVSIHELPSRIFEEFAEMTGGLVTNTALVSLSVVRERTHSVLSKMHKRLDAPFLTHRILIAHPEDASEFLVSLVGQELSSLVNTEDAYKQVSFEAIQVWIDENHSDESLTALDDNNKPTQLDRELVKRLIRIGKDEGFSGTGVPGLKKTSAHKKLTNALSRSHDKANSSTFDEEFAMLTTLQTRYEVATSPPLLSLGVVLAKHGIQVYCGSSEKKNDERETARITTTYWLCIQPPCDSVRIKAPKTRFPLLPLSISTDNKFHLVVPSTTPDERVRLKMTKKLSGCEIVEFRVENECVQARSEYNKFFFDSQQGRYYHVAQMKFVNAQAAINGFSAELSRVGTDISEWLRSFE